MAFNFCLFKRYTLLVFSRVFANQNPHLRVPRPIVAPVLLPPSCLSHYFITPLLPYFLLNRRRDEKPVTSTPLVPADYRCTLAQLLSLHYKCPGGVTGHRVHS